MIDYPTMETGRSSIVMFAAYYRLEIAKFVFTKRTGCAWEDLM